MIKKVFNLITGFSKKIKDDHIGAYSGQATLFIVISMFPFLMFLLSLIQYLPISESNIMLIVNDIFPSNISPIFIQIIYEVYNRGSVTITSITAITALWSASKGFIALGRGLNCVYGIKETRNYIWTRISAALYTLAFAVIIIITLSFLVFGNRLYFFIENVFPILKDTALIIISLRAVVGFAILVIFFLILYIAIPNRKTKIVNELPGSILSAVGWMVFSFLYSFYIDNMGPANTYGSLTAIVLFMLWLYFCLYILFIGGEINDILRNQKWKKEISEIL